MKHIRKNRKFICSVYKKEFTRHHNLKLQIIKSHNLDQVLEKAIASKSVVGELYYPKRAEG